MFGKQKSDGPKDKRQKAETTKEVQQKLEIPVEKMPSETKSKKTSPKKKWLIPVIVGGVVLAAIIGGGIYVSDQLDLVYSDVTIEAGSKKPPVDEFLKHTASNVAFTKDSDFDVDVPGDYDLTIQWKVPVLGTRTYQTLLHVVDTTAPEIVLENNQMEIYTTAEAIPSPADFVKEVNDVTGCQVQFAENYDFSKEGTIEAKIIATDSSGNSSEKDVKVTVIDDVTPPVISGVETLTISQGDAVSYKKNITVTDDHDPNPTLEVNANSVNVDKRGSYTVYYTATDAAGNTSKASAAVKVVSAKIADATEEVVYGKADEILSQITNDSMTQKEVAKAIFDWTIDNITYKETAGMDDLLSAAYSGFFYHKGDCTVKQKTAEVLLKRAGIKCMEIEKIRDTRGHYWLLIDIGEGWYHYDPNLQLDGTEIFYWHDADLWAYSNAHKNTHNYDPSKYPHIE